MELTVVMPCLNEAETVATCVRKAVKFIADSGISGEVVVADNGSTDGSQQLAADAGARVVHDPGQGLRQCPDGRHPGGPRRVRDHGRRRRQLRLHQPDAVRRRAPQGQRPGDGQPLQGRHRAGRDAAAAQVPRQPGAVLRRPPVLPQQDRRLPLRPARLPAGQRDRARPAGHRHGVRQRDGREGHPREAEDHRGAHHAHQGRPQPPAAPAQLARRLAAPAVPAAVQPALAVLRARPRHRRGRPRHRRRGRGGPAHDRRRHVRRGHAGRGQRDGG